VGDEAAGGGVEDDDTNVICLGEKVIGGAFDVAGETIETVLTHLPANGAPLGGMKVIAGSGWFAARPSGTEDICKIYAESFREADPLRRILEEAQTIVTTALAALSGKNGDVTS